MEKRNLYIVIAVVAIVLVAGVAAALTMNNSSSKTKTKVSEIGSDTMLELMQLTAEDFNAGSSTASVSITGGGSGVGITKLIEGSTDVARPPGP